MRFSVSMVIEDLEDLRSCFPPVESTPDTMTEYGEPRTFLPLYLTDTKYVPGTEGVYEMSYPLATSVQERSTFDGPSTVIESVPAPTLDVSTLNFDKEPTLPCSMPNPETETDAASFKLETLPTEILNGELGMCTPLNLV